VLDSYALLEWLLGQPGAAAVRRILEQAADDRLQVSMSWINLGEVTYMLARRRGWHAAEKFINGIPALPLRAIVPDVEDILGAARIKAKAKVSYADAFAIGLAVSLKADIVTGDPEIRALALVPVIWLGR